MAARILVVDDNPLNRKLACDLLLLEGYNVQACEDAMQAQALLAEGSPPDLVLMDIALPDIDGLTLTRRIKADPRFATMPVVAMTAFAMKGDEAKALAAGCSGYISKPIDTRRFPTQVAEVLAAVPAKPPMRIMIVEDHRVDLKLFGASAELLGHLVFDSGSAEQALESLAASAPDVVLLDLNLPGIDGLAFLRRIRADPKTCGLPVVAVTAYPEHYHREALLEAGCDGYLTKPVSLQVLQQALEEACRPVAGPAPG